ncbi:MAG: FMN-binding protein [Rikenellaceae bacterium]
MRGIILSGVITLSITALSSAQGSVQIIDTTPYTKDIYGYKGPVPIKLHLQDGIIQKVELLPNLESPHRVKFIIEDGLLERWRGVKADDAQSVKIDATAGATLTTDAIVENVNIAAKKALQPHD